MTAARTDATPAAPRGDGQTRRRWPRHALVPWLFLAPALVFGIVFFLLPILFAGYISLTRWNSLTPPQFIGLSNYRHLLTVDPRFWSTVGNTLLFAAGSIAIGLPLALVLASAFVRARGEAVWRLVYWLPMVTHVVAVAYIWRFLLDDGYGLVNRGLAALGAPAVGWLTDPNVAMLSVILVFVWMQLGQNILLFTAGLAGIDPLLHDAARLDGASPARIFRHVTVPLLRPTILFALVTNLITGLSYFALMLVLTEGGPPARPRSPPFISTTWRSRISGSGAPRRRPISSSPSSSSSRWFRFACCGAAAWRRTEPCARRGAAAPCFASPALACAMGCWRSAPRSWCCPSSTCSSARFARRPSVWRARRCISRPIRNGGTSFASSPNSRRRRGCSIPSWSRCRSPARSS